MPLSAWRCTQCYFEIVIRRSKRLATLTSLIHLGTCPKSHGHEPQTWRRKIWYRALRGKQLRVRKPYTMRHTFISVGLTNDVNPQWLAEYCGTSMAMIDKHYGKYIRNDSQEQLSHLFGAKSATLSETLEAEEEQKQSQVVGNSTEGD